MTAARKVCSCCRRARGVAQIQTKAGNQVRVCKPCETVLGRYANDLPRVKAIMRPHWSRRNGHAPRKAWY